MIASRLVSGIAAILVVGTVAACSAPESPPTPAVPDAGSPLPAGASLVTSTEPPPPDASCADVTASLPPDRAGGPAVDAIRARGRVVVGLDTGSNLMSFRDPTTGELAGFDVDIAREIARDLLGDPNAIDFRLLPSANRVRAHADGDVDIVTKTMSITCERREAVDFSTVYLTAEQRILVPDGSSVGSAVDLAGKRVCAAYGSTSLTRMQRVQPAASIMAVVTWGDCLVLLQQNQVDAVSTDDTLLAGLASQDPFVRIVGPSMGTEPYGVGIGPDKPDLVRFVNATLERVRTDGTWAASYARWLRVLGPTPPPPAPRYVS